MLAYKHSQPFFSSTAKNYPTTRMNNRSDKNLHDESERASRGSCVFPFRVRRGVVPLGKITKQRSSSDDDTHLMHTQPQPASQPQREEKLHVTYVALQQQQQQMRRVYKLYHRARVAARRDVVSCIQSASLALRIRINSPQPNSSRYPPTPCLSFIITSKF